ncbi:efflux RND transporter permease subunit [Roseibium denhamense]|uniref:efflux RND transporter permease subunit n=1 Tax=Roseibium denhamense TaxID=76305 RepID=UPI001AD92B35
MLRAISPEVSAELIGGLRINATTYVSDVALVQLTGEDRDAFARSNGRPSIGLDIVRQSVGNTLTISQDVRTAVEELRTQLPDGVSLDIMTDDGIFIEGSIKEVTLSILMAIGIVVVVIFLFLRSWRATLIPAAAIPVALVGTLGAIWLVGFSINTISLLALVLAAGMVVDDAIVVVENIVRRRQDGEGARLAAVSGANEVFFAVLSTTATLAAVFVPISFLPGQAGGVFSEFGFVLAFCVTISSIVALTLVPMLASILDPGRPRKARSAAAPAESGTGRESLAARLFLNLVDRAIKLPVLAIGIAFALAVLAFGASQTLTSTLTPQEDRGMFFMMVKGPVGASNDYMNAQAAEIEAILEPYKDSGEIEAVLSLIGRGGGTTAFVVVRLADWDERTRSQAEIGAELNGKLEKVAGSQVLMHTPNSLRIRGGGAGLKFAVSGNDYAKLAEGADALIAAMEADPSFANPQLSSNDTAPQVGVDIDRDRALELGIKPDTVADMISAATQGITATSVYLKGEEVDLVLKVGGKPVNDQGDLERVFARTDTGSIIPLSSVTQFTTDLAQSSFARENGALAISINANLPDGVSLGASVARMMDLAATTLPDGVSVTLLGEAAELESGKSGTYLIFAVAGLIVLLVLAAQFESFMSALIIMLTVPFGLAAAMMAITLTGGTLNYYSQIGLVMLIGVMAKNGILIVEFADQLREQGHPVDAAIREAVRLRLRPVMMTMISTVFGGLPLILTSGAGAEARMAVGWVVVGGLGFATIFTLFLIPVLYRWIAPLGGKPGAASQKLLEEMAS